jgi:hypothetical protein
MDGSLVTLMHNDHVQELDRKNSINSPGFMMLLGWIVTRKGGRGEGRWTHIFQATCVGCTWHASIDKAVM